METYEKRGYLNREFLLFHLSDTKKQDFEYHYHDFDKIIIFIKGKVEYTIEGKTYVLKPYDIVLVNHHDIHRPSIDSSFPYERIIVYLSPGFITSYCTESYDLSRCFQKAKAEQTNVLRIHSLKTSSLFHTITNLEQAYANGGYANELFLQVLFLEFMIQLNRAAESQHLEYLQTEPSHTAIGGLLDYINKNLTSDLSIDTLSRHCYLSKYYMMRLFKQETGYSLGTYIKNKRLLLAKDLLLQGIPITQVCFDCGFNHYSTFSRAYKKTFGTQPKLAKQLFIDPAPLPLQEEN